MNEEAFYKALEHGGEPSPRMMEERTQRLEAALREVLAYRRGLGKHNYSRYFTQSERDNAAFDGWQKVEEQIEAALTSAKREGD